MKCQILFSGKNKKISPICLLLILAQRVVKVKTLNKIVADNILKLILLLFRDKSHEVSSFIFSEK